MNLPPSFAPSPSSRPPLYIYHRLGAMKITQEKLLAAIELQTQILANIDRNLTPLIMPSEEEPPVQ
jgi:hypothetical protein